MLLVLVVAGASAQPSFAAWVAVTSNGGNQVTTATSFPTYPQSVTADGAWSYLREEESPSSASTLAAADSTSNNHPGTYSGTTNGPSTWWKFGEGSGTTAADSSGGGNAGALTNSPTWTTGPSGNALSFNGSNTYVAGSTPAVHTNASLTVAAWVYLNSTAADGYAVSQNGSHTAAFTLGFDSASSKFAFRMSNSDVVGATIKTQFSRVVSAGYWYHLLGVYDTTTSKIYLYVNGAAVGNSSKTVNWDATGPLEVGRGYLDDAWAGNFNGKVEDVRVYDRALSGTEITNLADGSPQLQWDFSEGSGTTAADSSPVGDDGTLGSGLGFPIWTAGHVGNALSMTILSGGYVQSALTALTTKASFSVSAWAYLSSLSVPGTRRSALSEASTTSSGFLLYVDTSNKWSFSLPETDASNPTLDTAQSNSIAAVDTWVHLVGVFDASANGGNGSVALYVNGTLQTTSSQHIAANRFIATANAQAGRALWNGAYQYPWEGGLDSVRMYQRALSQADVTALSNDTEPAATWTEASMTLGVAGALQGTYQGLSASTGTAFAGAATAYDNTSVVDPTTFTIECWFRVSGNLGGEIVGFHQNAPGDTGSHDRTLYMDSGGNLSFATYVGAAQTVRSPAAYNDGAWHHAAASLGAAGMKLYVDGNLVASNSGITTAGNYAGYWRWGGGTLASMTNRPTSDYLTGSIDEVAIYSTQLTDATVSLHRQRNY